MKHTPGPWEFEKHQPTGNFSVQSGGFGFVTVYANRSKHPLADARLIAAAPDMEKEIAELKQDRTDKLEVLKELVTWLYDEGLIALPAKTNIFNDPSPVAAAQAVITKTEKI